MIIIHYGLTLLRLASTFCWLTPSPHWQYARHWSSESLPDKELLSDSLAARETQPVETRRDLKISEDLWTSTFIQTWYSNYCSYCTIYTLFIAEEPFKDNLGWCFFLDPFFFRQPHPSGRILPEGFALLRSSPTKREHLFGAPCRGLGKKLGWTTAHFGIDPISAYQQSAGHVWSHVMMESKQTPTSREILWGPIIFKVVGGLEHFLFFHILGMSSSQLTNIFQRGRYTTNQ